MAEDDLIVVQPDARFADVPVAMALLILRCAMWPAPRDNAEVAYEIRVTYRGRHRYRLTEHGDWTQL
jgi:hypothetical protein